MSEFTVEAKVTPNLDESSFTRSVEDQIGEITADIKSSATGGKSGGGTENIVSAILTQTSTLVPFLRPLGSIKNGIGLISDAYVGVKNISSTFAEAAKQVVGGFSSQFAEDIQGLFGGDSDKPSPAEIGKGVSDEPVFPEDVIKESGEKIADFEEMARDRADKEMEKFSKDDRGQMDMGALLAPLEGIAGSIGTIKSFTLLISGAVSSAVGFLASLPVTLSTVIIAGITTLLAGLTIAFRDEIGNFARGVSQKIQKLLPEGPILPTQEEILNKIQKILPEGEILPTQEEVLQMVTDLFDFGEKVTTKVIGAVEDLLGLEDGKLKSYVSDIFDLGEGVVKGYVKALFNFATDPEAFFITKVANPFIRGVNTLISAINGLIKTIPKSVRKASGIKTMGTVDTIDVPKDKDKSDKSDSSDGSDERPRGPPRRDPPITNNISINVQQNQQDLARQIRKEVRNEVGRADSYDRI